MGFFFIVVLPKLKVGCTFILPEGLIFSAYSIPFHSVLKKTFESAWKFISNPDTWLKFAFSVTLVNFPCILWGGGGGG